MNRSCLLLLLLPLVTAAGCGDHKVDTTKIEQGIEAQVKAAGSSVTKVDCPADVKAEKGASFQCGVSFANGATGKVKVTQVRVGSYQYEVVPGSLHVPGSVFEEQIQQDLKQQGVSSAKVNCPDDVIVKVGTYAVCDVMGPNGTKVGTVKFTFSDASGTVDDSSVSTTA